MAKRGKRKINIKINLTNRWLYTLIALGILAVIGIGVYATVDKTTAWHSANQVEVTIGGSGAGAPGTDKSLQEAINNGDLGSKWIQGSRGIYYNSNVGVGTTTPTQKLDVYGTIRAMDAFAPGGKNIIIGDDAFLTDIDEPNTLGIHGLQNPAQGAISLGYTGDNKIEGFSSGVMRIFGRERLDLLSKEVVIEPITGVPDSGNLRVKGNLNLIGFANVMGDLYAAKGLRVGVRGNGVYEYLKIDSGTETPSSSDCNEDSETGRMYFESDAYTKGALWICNEDKGGWQLAMT